MHGGDIYGEKIEYDYSVNINPIGAPKGVLNAIEKSLNKLSQYPDIHSRDLCLAIAEHHGVSDKTVVCTNGASELIQTICYMIRPKKALVVSPCFSGYERSLENNGADIKYVEVDEADGFEYDESISREILSYKPELVIVANPNNPNGKIIKRDIGEKIIRACESIGAHIVIDECFIELSDQGETASYKDLLANSKGMIIIRAFTKSYGLPGLRLGYGLCSDESLARWIEMFLPEWNISIPAQTAGQFIMKNDNTEYLANSRKLIKEERDYLTAQLKELGMIVYSSDANFILFKCSKRCGEEKTDIANELQEYLKKTGILIRDCSDYKGLGKGYYRICIKNHDDNEKLIEELNSIITRN